MTFDEVLSQTIALLQRERRVSYRGLKRRFGVDDAFLEDLKAEIVKAKKLAIDEEGEVLVWVGEDRVSGRARGPTNAGEQVALTPPDSRPQTPDTAWREGDRRQLTVMFCDLVGSTALSTQLDPEELHSVVHHYQRICATVISRYDGYIAQYLGDGLLVYFGYPVAHEDAARRAVRTGLEIIPALRHATVAAPSALLQVRIGIHTGLVVLGDIGAGARIERLALGETPNIAARLQSLAAPDTVTVSAATHRLIEGYFECESLGAHAIKGVATPRAVYRVLQEGQAASHIDVAAARGLTPLVGRASELEVLLARWEEAKAGQGQVALVHGEAGIGKSRLVQTLKEHVTREGYTRWEMRCSPYHQNSALYPVIEGLQRVLQFTREEAPEHKFHKLEQWLRVAGKNALAPELAPSEAAPLFAAFLSVPLPDHYPVVRLTPQKQKEKTHQAVVALLVEYARRHPLMVVWEDLHWADPSTIELLGLFFAHVPTSPLLTVLTFRPDFVPPWPMSSHVSTLALHRLSSHHTAAMIACLTGGKALPVAILQQLVMKTDGVPLFVEEFTKMVLESDVLRESAEGYTLASPLATLAIPTTLQDSLMARLDRLSPVKEVAQLGATVGREFSYALLRAVAPLDEPSLQSALAHLVAAEILYGRGLAPQARYFFKHALIQETAYQSLLRSRRQQYHHKIAQVLEVDFPDITETQPEVVAHHYTEAGLAAQAIPYWQYAGQRATERSAYVEAIAHLTRGLEVLQTLPDTPEHVSQELTLHLALGVPLVATRGYGASEVEKVYARAHKLCHHMGETPQLVPVLRGLGIFYTARAELHTARELGEQLLTLAQGLQDSGALLEAHFTLGAPLFYLGEFVLASHHMEQGVALYDPQQHRGHAAIYGQDAGVACLGFTAWALWLRGYPDAALTRSYEALSLAQELAHPYSLAWAMVFVAVIHHLRREGRQTRERAEVEMALANEQGFPFWVAAGMCFWGWALMTEGQVTQGVGQISQGLRIWQTTGAELIKPYFLSMLAEAYGHDKQMAAGFGVLAEARTLGDTHGERWWHAELYRFEGEFFLQQGSPDAPQAERCFHQAIALARHQQAKSLELRAAMSLTRLWQRQGQRAEAYELLAPIYGWFTEGFDTPDLQEAKALLEELEA